MHRSSISVVGLTAAALIAFAGCADGGGTRDGTLGDQGRVAFSYQQSCFFGCPLEQPLLVGTREKIGVDGAGDGEGVEASSSAPDVVEVALERDCYCERADHSGSRLEIAQDASCDGIWKKHCDNTLLLQANDRGSAQLELHAQDGALIDRATVLVHEAASAELQAQFPDELAATDALPGLTLGAGEHVDLDLRLYDDDGRKLLAPEGVRWSVDDGDVASLVAWLVASGAQVDAGLGVELDALAAGATSLTIRVPGLEQTIDVTVDEP